MVEKNLFWHDYEIWGIRPRQGRASKFAGIRTNLALEVVDDPVMIYSKLGIDFLPHPESVLITGITPQKAAIKELPEADF